MARYAALLRGVNVGTKRLAMADLRRIVGDLGYENAKTYLQSGNVVFDCPPAEDGTVARAIGRALKDELALDVPVLVRSGDELAAVVEAGPYEDDPARVLVAFLSAAPEPGKVAGLTVPGGENLAYQIKGVEVFLHFPDGGYGRTKFTNAYLEKRLGVVATTRNWKSVLALRDLTA